MVRNGEMLGGLWCVVCGGLVVEIVMVMILWDGDGDGGVW